jgi:short-subunit dehydrogenase
MPSASAYSCALVTGASAGLGEEFAFQIAPRVDQLVLVARREALLSGLAERLRATFPGLGVCVKVVDLALPSDLDRLLGELAAEGISPDLLINNAGLGDYGEFTSAEWSKAGSMLDVNIKALTRLTHALVPAMVERGGGAVVNISSLASVLPIPDFAVYAATKAYVTSFSEALRIELKSHGVKVLAVCPGPVRTEFGSVARRNENSPGMPAKKSFYVPKQQVVAESLAALDAGAARVYPATKTKVAAALLSAMPNVLLRFVMGFRPRRL